jgi:hypothetical protein
MPLISLLAAIIIVLGSFDAYQIEDDGAAGRIAHQLYSLVNLTYEGMYIMAMAVFTLGVFIIVQLIFHYRRPMKWLSLSLIAIGTILAAFGGLLVRQPQVFLLVVGSYLLILVLTILAGELLTSRFFSPELASQNESRNAEVFGACSSILFATLLNLLCAIWHTFLVQGSSPQLYAETFSGLTGGHMSEYELFNILGTVFTLLAGIVVLRVGLNKRNRMQ